MICKTPRWKENIKANKNLFIFRPSTSPGKPARKPTGKPVSKLSPKGKPSSKASPLDARSKIIQKNRFNIRDAREKIASNARKSIKDARELLSTKKPVARPTKKVSIPRSRLGDKSGRSMKGIAADLLMDDDEDDFDMSDLRDLHLKPIGSIKRTVRNDIAYRAAPPSMPKLPHFNINQEISRLSPDPFDCYVVPTRRPIPVPPMRQERLDRGYQAGRPMSAHMDAYEPRKSILRASQRDDHDDRFEDDRYFSSSAGVRSRLNNDSRDRNESAGIFAKLPVRGSSPPPAQIGHRIIISNLHTSVNESDVRELFEDVGQLVTAQLVRPGIAEVVYKNLGDAEEAVETYHNRQLDGQPMKCMLVRSSSKPSYSRL
jgi:polymerase delta-interacting protein 3